jgi:uncharacterized protein (DUF983 family)
MTIEYGTARAKPEQGRPLGRSMQRGFLCRCPNCGEGRLFKSFVKTVDACAVCGEDIHHHRADDLPAYLVVFIVGHLVVGGFMGQDALYPLPLWGSLALWVPLTLLASLALLQPVKGAAVGLQWALRMHGFGGEEDQAEPIDP